MIGAKQANTGMGVEPATTTACLVLISLIAHNNYSLSDLSASRSIEKSPEGIRRDILLHPLLPVRFDDLTRGGLQA
jgi:hypothetical protein